MIRMFYGKFANKGENPMNSANIIHHIILYYTVY
jgi:hypothetical protein